MSYSLIDTVSYYDYVVCSVASNGPGGDVEYQLIDRDGKLEFQSNQGYGCAGAAMRGGLNHAAELMGFE